MRNTAAASAERIGRTQYDRITDLVRKGNSVFHRFHDFRRCDRLPDFFHCTLKFQTVLRFFDRLRGRTDQPHLMFAEKASFLKLHRQIQSRLAAERRQHTVRLFLQDKLFHNFYCQRFDIDLICDIFVCHNGRRIGVQQYDLNPFFFQRTACLRSCIVELGSLSDHDRAGADHKYLFNIRILRHYAFTSIIFINRSNR